MELIWKTILIFSIYSPLLISSISLDSFYLDLIHRNISDFNLFNKFYRNFLHDVRQHRVIDTVSSAIDLEKIRTKNYNEDYLKHSCYETASDLLNAHGYTEIDLKLSPNDLQSLLPAILNTIENPGCQRQLPRIKQYPFLNEWIFGFLCLILMKLIHVMIFFIAGSHSSALTSNGITRTISQHSENIQNPDDEVRFPPIKYHLWLGLGFNALTCGIILGTIIYHLIPHIYGVPNEDVDYTYLLRGTVILCGVFLFFIVEKLLRFRFKVDETQFEESAQMTTPSDASMIQMANMHGTFHMHKNDHGQHSHSETPLRLPSNVDSGDEETHLQAVLEHIQHETRLSQNDAKRQRRNVILYHVIYDFSNDIIYGCGFATAVAHDRLIGFVLWIMIFSEGFRRHSELLSSVGRKHGFTFLFISIVFLLIGYLIGGALVQINEQWNINTVYLQKEYIYSIVYGALFYTALVTLIPELNDFGQYLQTVTKTVNQTSKQRRLLKALILICQNLFLLIGVLLILLLAIIWRYYHRMNIFEYVCKRDSSHRFCS